MYERLLRPRCAIRRVTHHPGSLLQVRKTANEFYLAAAGLPDPDLLPQPTDRAVGLASYGFAIINVMDNVNLEISRKGIPITFSVQEGY